MFVLGLYLVLALADNVSVLLSASAVLKWPIRETTQEDLTAPNHLSLLLDNDWQFLRLNCGSLTVAGKPSTIKMLLFNTSAEKILFRG